jgi:putative ABC transport system substrate-binding protein
MRRRNFISLIGTAAAWPLAARAELPIVGYLSQGTAEATADLIANVRLGLKETGLIEGANFTSELRFANNDADRLPGLVLDLVRRRVSVILVVDTVPAARAAKAATSEIPVVFATGTDPVQSGLVANLNHPGGNVTGITTMNLDLGSKWVELLRELVPNAKRFAILVNIENGGSARLLITGTQEAALAFGLQTEIIFASSDGEIDQAFAGLGARSQALIIHPDVLFRQRLQKLADLAIRKKLPALFALREFPKVGGLISYGSSFNDAHRLVGIYAARILKGEKAGDLPVQRASKFDLILNMKTAKAIGLDIPATFLARADEVIE